MSTALRTRHRGSGRRRPKPSIRGLPRHVDVDELALRIEYAPSRAQMTRPKPKADYLEHAWRFYNAARRWGHAVGSAHYDGTWAQLIAACGYPEDAKVERSVRHYAAILEELGLLRVYGVTDQFGAWQRVDVELLEPPPLESWLPAGVAQSVRAAES